MFSNFAPFKCNFWIRFCLSNVMFVTSSVYNSHFGNFSFLYKRCMVTFDFFKLLVWQHCLKSWLATLHPSDVILKVMLTNLVLFKPNFCTFSVSNDFVMKKINLLPDFTLHALCFIKIQNFSRNLESNNFSYD